MYVCRARKCVSRKAERVDDLIEGVVVERLSRPDAADLLTAQADPDLASKRGQVQAIRERLDDLAVGLEEGVLTLTAVRKSSTRLRAELMTVETAIDNATHADVLSPLVGAPDVGAAWQGADLQQRRAVVDALMTITLLQPERGQRAFDPESVSIDWKTDV